MINELTLIQESTKKAPAPAKPARWRAKDLRVLTSSLARLLAGGVTLLRALRVLREESERPAFAEVLGALEEKITQGRSLSEAMEAHEKIFPHYLIQMVRAGEHSGTLEKVLASLALHLEKQAELTRKVREALTYPAFVVVMGILTGFVMLQVVIPKITLVYEGFRQELPWMTQFTIALSKASGFILLAFAGLVFGAWHLVHRYRAQVMARLFRTPVLGAFLQTRLRERFTSMLSLLLESGIPMLEALRMSSEASSLEFMRPDMERMREHLAHGGSLSEALRGARWMPGTSLALIVSGEESGRLPESLAQIAREAAGELDSRLQMLVKLLEPILILVIGLGVTFVVLSVLLPIFDLGVV